jgi:hypothetical protein
MGLGRVNRPIVLAIAGLLGCAQAGHAADCAFKNAVYIQKESGYVLRFADSRELGRFPGTSNVFYVDVPNFHKPLLSWVIWNNGESRPTGTVMLDCPDDGMTNDDFAACTQWEGVLYALSGDNADLLPGEDEPAPKTILLPDFGRKMRYSAVGDLQNVPWDIFRYDRCGA